VRPHERYDLRVALEPGRGCPDWFLANDDEVGYYRVRYQGDMLGHLLDGGANALTLAETTGLLGDASQLARMGAFPPPEALALDPRFRG
jgi:hypothetical protein